MAVLPPGRKRLIGQVMFDNLTGQGLSGSGALPSLNALRAFEAMARTGGATAAAAELCVTHSAVSRQVKALEAALGVRLFEGPKHRLVLTEAGRALLPRLTEAFDGMAAGVSAARGQGRDLQLAVHASLSVKWLIPRLQGFSARRPDVRLHLAELAPHAMSQRGADAVLRIVGPEALDDPRALPFMANAVGPVIAPSLLAASGRPEAETVLTAPRLTSRPHPRGWRIWAELAGIDLPKAEERTVAHLHFALDAALAGWGAAVLPWPLVADEVAAGRLSAPLGFLPDGGAFVAIRGAGADSGALNAFLRWLQAEGARTPPAPSPVAIGGGRADQRSLNNPI